MQLRWPKHGWSNPNAFTVKIVLQKVHCMEKRSGSSVTIVSKHNNKNNFWSGTPACGRTDKYPTELVSSYSTSSPLPHAHIKFVSALLGSCGSHCCFVYTYDTDSEIRCLRCSCVEEFALWCSKYLTMTRCKAFHTSKMKQWVLLNLEQLWMLATGYPAACASSFRPASKWACIWSVW